jgi:hypothetical protein
MQCMAGAMTAAAGATGARAWLAGRVGPRMLKRLTVVLIAAAIVVAATVAPN